MVKVLLAAKADVNVEDFENRTALHEAAKRGHIEVVKELLATKADVNVENLKNRTALHEAKKRGHIEVVKELSAATADVNAGINKRGSTALSAAAHGGAQRRTEVIKRW